MNVTTVRIPRQARAEILLALALSIGMALAGMSEARAQGFVSAAQAETLRRATSTVVETPSESQLAVSYRGGWPNPADRARPFPQQHRGAAHVWWRQAWRAHAWASQRAGRPAYDFGTFVLRTRACPDALHPAVVQNRRAFDLSLGLCAVQHGLTALDRAGARGWHPDAAHADGWHPLLRY